MYQFLMTMPLDPETLITVAASLAVLLGALGVILPHFARDRTRERMKVVTDHRGRLRERRLEERSRKSGLRRQKAVTGIRALVDRLKVRDALAGPAVRRKLIQANWRGQAAVAIFAAARLATPVLLGAFAALILFGGTYRLTPQVKTLICFGWTVAGFYLPNILLTNAIQRRQIAFTRAFPDALDLLLICVESGLSMEAAVSRVAREIGPSSPVVAEEMELTAAELAYLPDRRQALENLSNRVGLPAVKAVVGTLIQAERYGTPLTAALRVAARENREARMAAAERKASALPAKLTVPMVVFFLPVLFIVILGPAIIQLTDGR